MTQNHSSYHPILETHTYVLEKPILYIINFCTMAVIMTKKNNLPTSGMTKGLR